jgi:hypothetical protein
MKDLKSLINAIEIVLSNDKSTDAEKIKQIKGLVEFAKMKKKENCVVRGN